MSTFITRLDPGSGTGPRLAVKDLIDVRDVPTTAGSRAVERTAGRRRDAAAWPGPAAGARIVARPTCTSSRCCRSAPTRGSARLPTRWTPLIPGGSSSGSAVAVATGEADVALGSDTGGSIRVPSACCGTAGLKTTYGRVPLDGVWPLAPSLDTVGPMAATVGGLIAGMRLLEPGFTPAAAHARTIGRLRTSARPEIEQAIDESLKRAGLEVVTLDWDGFAAGANIFATIYLTEVWDTDHALAQTHPDGVGEDIAQLLTMNDLFRPGLAEARGQLAQWRRSLLDLFGQVELLALPTMPVFPPRLADLTPASLVDTIVEITSTPGCSTRPGCRARLSRCGPRARASPRACNSSARRTAKSCCSARRCWSRPPWRDGAPVW